MARYFLNSLTLHEVGLRLLPDENVVVAVELEGGLTEELEQSEATLLLTNRRLVRYYAAGHKASVISTVLDDIDSVEVVRSRRNKQWMWVGTVFVAGGILLGIVSLMLAWPTLSPLLMALSLVLIGVVFGIAYRSGMAGEVIVRAGVKDIRCKMGPKALNDMATFLEKYYELKLGYNTEPNDADSIASPQAAATSGAAETPAG